MLDLRILVKKRAFYSLLFETIYFWLTISTYFGLDLFKICCLSNVSESKTSLKILF